MGMTDDSPRVYDEVERVVRCWPVGEPLFALCSGGELCAWNRWTILARPSVMARFVGGRTEIFSVGGGKKEQRFIEVLKGRMTHDPAGDLMMLLNAGVEGLGLGSCCGGSDCGVPFHGGWIGSISYDLGVCLEPSARHGVGIDTKRGDCGGVLFEMGWCVDGVVYDRLEGRWYEVGEAPVRVGVDDGCSDVENDLPYMLSEFVAESSQGKVEQAVARTIEYIRAGDIFQANISQRFHASFSGNRRGMFLKALERNPSWYSAYLELGDERTILSLSPELFFSFDELSREVVTRPIKGTEGVEVDCSVLEKSVKDQAELNMIVDLMRNDLGRVCEFGSVGVRGGRMIETHGTVHHGVATVGGRVHAGLGVGDILRAVFPGGSITGAPKIRAMQIIDELEDFKRGLFFGAIGYAGRRGACFNLAIRTMLIEGGRAMYVAGGGIVADSDPGKEYEEMLVKVRGARVLCS